jgi:Flp pilus assembly pilin Flp
MSREGQSAKDVGLLAACLIAVIALVLLTVAGAVDRQVAGAADRIGVATETAAR